MSLSGVGTKKEVAGEKKAAGKDVWKILKDGTSSRADCLEIGRPYNFTEI